MVVSTCFPRWTQLILTLTCHSLISFVPFTFILSYSNKMTPEVFSAEDPNVPQGLPISRGAFETLLRRLVFNSRTNVSFISGTVDGFTRQDDRHVSGVTVRDQAEETATFIVGASV